MPIFGATEPFARSEQRVDKRRGGRAGKENQHAEQEHDNHDRQQPPFLVLLEKRPEFAEQAFALMLGGGFFKITGWLGGCLAHGISGNGQWSVACLGLERAEVRASFLLSPLAACHFQNCLK